MVLLRSFLSCHGDVISDSVDVILALAKTNSIHVQVPVPVAFVVLLILIHILIGIVDAIGDESA